MKNQMMGPNYRVGVEEISERVARKEIDKNHNPELLYDCSRRDTKHSELASYTPEFFDVEESKAIPF
ncbi:hypothetical protein CEP52_006481 [Fusarium oligoseptatum]|uniref:Uncharacterized protein n=1 Tax=Fusarium oligoseptatum TaxID=2604345 RepID=A0A428TSR0_9HYPO|nr:hypothetical protein CEP52_006481 [Fusarium oligoseptatum]